jgi:hypothetical protein
LPTFPGSRPLASIRTVVVTMSPIVADLLATLLAGMADVVARFDDRSAAETELATNNRLMISTNFSALADLSGR